MLPSFDYIRPKTAQAVITHLATGNAQAHAGGTDLMGCLREHIFPVGKVVSLSGLSELRGVSEIADGGLRIGALTTLSALSEHPIVIKRFSGLAQAAGEVGSPQLRNQGTLGGNICQKPRCWYYRTDFTCLRKAGHLLRGGRRESVSLHLRRWRHLFHRAPLRHRPRAGGVERDGAPGGAQGDARCAPGEILRVA